MYIQIRDYNLKQRVQFTIEIMQHKTKSQRKQREIKVTRQTKSIQNKGIKMFKGS